jgi:hypothetical protein
MTTCIEAGIENEKFLLHDAWSLHMPCRAALLPAQQRAASFDGVIVARLVGWGVLRKFAGDRK